MSDLQLPTPEPNGTSALEHLQRAATELIAAARIVLDRAEELVNDSLEMVGNAGHGVQATQAGRPPTPVSPVEKIEVAGRDETKS